MKEKPDFTPVDANLNKIQLTPKRQTHFNTKTTKLFEPENLYLLQSDIWCIDYTNKDFMIIKCRDQEFKVKPENLRLMEVFNG